MPAAEVDPGRAIPTVITELVHRLDAEIAALHAAAVRVRTVASLVQRQHDAALALHQPDPGDEPPGCTGCPGVPWPCATAHALRDWSPPPLHSSEE